MEQGIDIVTATYQIHEYHGEEHLEEVGLSCVHCTIKRFGPVIRKIRIRK
jgi:hypothetical protein